MVRHPLSSGPSSSRPGRRAAGSRCWRSSCSLCAASCSRSFVGKLVIALGELGDTGIEHLAEGVAERDVPQAATTLQDVVDQTAELRTGLSAGFRSAW